MGRTKVGVGSAAAEPRSRANKKKVSVSLSRVLLQYADDKAKQEGSNRSEIIEAIISEAKARDEDDLAAEGYRFFADEAREFAEMSIGPASEAQSPTEDAGPRR